MQRSLKDSRSGKVIFLSHCILNENTRYLGGACRGGVIREIVEQCLDKDIGIVQMPCPEQIAWGGVTKRLMLQDELGKRLIHVPFTAHDLIAEIQGTQTSATIPLS